MVRMSVPILGTGAEVGSRVKAVTPAEARREFDFQAMQHTRVYSLYYFRHIFKPTLNIPSVNKSTNPCTLILMVPHGFSRFDFLNRATRNDQR